MTVVVVAALAAGVGAVLLVHALWRPSEPARVGERAAAGRTPALPRRLLVAGVAGVSVGVATGWPVGAVLAVAAVVGLPALWGDRSARHTVDRLEAIASWTEMVRDTLHASAGLAQAVTTTAPLAPPPIRPSVRRLADRLSAGVPMVDALRALADDLDDPLGDVVVCALLLAVSAQAQRLGDLLGALATSARAEVAMRLRVEAARASAHSSVRIITVFTLGFVGTLLILARAYLAPFGTVTGQAVLALAGSFDALGLVLLTRMARQPRPPRLLAPAGRT